MRRGYSQEHSADAYAGQDWEGVAVVFRRRAHPFICLFVCLSSFVLCCHASSSAPEVPGPSGSDCSDPDSPPQLRTLAPHLHVLAGATGEEGFATLHRIFYEFTRACVFENRENEATGGVVWIFSSLALSLLMPLSAQGNTDPGS